MWPYALATLRDAWRSPLTWGLAGGGVFVGWFAATAAILALTRIDEQSQPLLFSTSHLAGVLLAVWLVGRAIDEDRHSGFAASADATRPGVPGRLLGRWLGAALVGCALSLVVGYTTAAATPLASPPVEYMLSTSIQATALAAAWAVLLGSLWRGGGTSLAVLLLWVLGHLPWGRAPFLEGLPGRLLRAWLPGPRAAEGAWIGLGYTSAAVTGLLLATVALSRPSDS